VKEAGLCGGNENCLETCAGFRSNIESTAWDKFRSVHESQVKVTKTGTNNNGDTCPQSLNNE
jgi:hypothetical protein